MRNTHTTLRQRARELLKLGALPTDEPSTLLGGNGEGQNCSLCGCPVESSEMEFEFSVGTTVYRFHLACHTAWQSECADDSGFPAELLLESQEQ
jgi:hypothetical protein